MRKFDQRAVRREQNNTRVETLEQSLYLILSIHASPERYYTLQEILAFVDSHALYYIQSDGVRRMSRDELKGVCVDQAQPIYIFPVTAQQEKKPKTMITALKRSVVSLLRTSLRFIRYFYHHNETHTFPLNAGADKVAYKFTPSSTLNNQNLQLSSSSEEEELQFSMPQQETIMDPLALPLPPLPNFEFLPPHPQIPVQQEEDANLDVMRQEEQQEEEEDANSDQEVDDGKEQQEEEEEDANAEHEVDDDYNDLNDLPWSIRGVTHENKLVHVKKGPLTPLKIDNSSNVNGVLRGFCFFPTFAYNIRCGRMSIDDVVAYKREINGLSTPISIFCWYVENDLLDEYETLMHYLIIHDERLSTLPDHEVVVELLKCGHVLKLNAVDPHFNPHLSQ